MPIITRKTAMGAVIANFANIMTTLCSTLRLSRSGLGVGRFYKDEIIIIIIVMMIKLKLLKLLRFLYFLFGIQNIIEMV